MTDSSYLTNQWNICYEILPKQHDLVIVFRTLRKKYFIACLKENIDKEENGDVNDFHWVTQHGSCFPVNDDDLWMKFPYVREEVLYD